MYKSKIVFCLFFNVMMTVLSSLAPTHLFVTRVGPCYDIQRTAVTISEMSIARRAYDSVTTGQLNVSRDIDNGWTVKATMQKCQDIRNIDTCDLFKSFVVVRRGCEEVHARDSDVYPMFFHFTHPRLSCPVKAGNYRIVEFPFFTEDNYLTVSEAKISTSMFGYTFRMEGFSDDQRILCVDSYLQLLYIREMNWLRSTSPAQDSADDNADETDYGNIQ